MPSSSLFLEAKHDHRTVKKKNSFCALEWMNEVNWSKTRRLYPCEWGKTKASCVHDIIQHYNEQRLDLIRHLWRILWQSWVLELQLFSWVISRLRHLHIIIKSRTHVCCLSFGSRQAFNSDTHRLCAISMQSENVKINSKQRDNPQKTKKKIKLENNSIQFRLVRHSAHRKVFQLH